MAGKIKAGICFASLICALALLLTSCNFRLKSEREVEKYLEKQYGQEFMVLSSESVTDDYYNDDVWRVMAYTVSPKDDPETQFLYSTLLKERVLVYQAFVTDYRTPIHLIFSAEHLKCGQLRRMWNILSTTSIP